MAVVISDAHLLIEVSSAVHEIETNNFYLDDWKKVKHRKPLWLCTRKELLEPFREFLFLLPNTPEVRRYPLMTICNLAERKC